MNDKCYVLQEQHKGSDFQWHKKVLCVYLNKEVALNEVKNLNQKFQEKICLAKEISNFKTDWYEKNPPLGVKMLQVPYGEVGSEFFDRVKSIEKKNKEILNECCAKCREACYKHFTNVPSDILEELYRNPLWVYNDSPYKEAKVERYFILECPLNPNDK